MGRGKGGIEINLRASVIVFVASLAVIYILYINLTPTKKQYKQYDMSWKTSEFVPIPSGITEKAKSVEVIERFLTFQSDKKEYTVYMKTASSPDAKFNVLLLHGRLFSSENWLTLNTLHLLVAMGYNAVAIDLPGWGKSMSRKLDGPENKAKFLTAFIAHERLDRPVIISPSMSGEFSLPYLMGGNVARPSSCKQRMRGFVPVAPVSTVMYSDDLYPQCEVPTLIIYGSKDTDLGPQSLSKLRLMSNKEIVELEGAGHACYLDKPDEWHYNLYNFLRAVEREDD